ncbi:MAG TPA: MarC family protein [Planctomycetaceae bacterium]|nr:MarC family protein [Planctomycetaceae bacterium]
MTESVNGLVNVFLLVYAGLFPIVNPIGAAPIFFGLTRDCTEQERRLLALQVALNSFALLLGSLFVGSYVLEFFGLTLPIVRIAGGLVVAAAGWNLLQAGNSGGDDRTEHRPIVPADAFYPLTMPLTVGPGSIAVAITLGSQRPRVAGPEVALLAGAAIAGLLAIAATIYVCYRFAEGAITRLGKHGTNVLVRLSAFILFCIGIAIIWNGYSALVPPRIEPKGESSGLSSAAGEAADLQKRRASRQMMLAAIHASPTRITKPGRPIRCPSRRCRTISSSRIRGSRPRCRGVDKPLRAAHSEPTTRMMIPTAKRYQG